MRSSSITNEYSPLKLGIGTYGTSNHRSTTLLVQAPNTPISSVTSIFTPFQFDLTRHCLRLQIVPGSNNAVAIELISTHIRRELANRAREFRCKITSEIKRNPSTSNPSQTAEEQSPNLHIIPQTPQLTVFRCTADQLIQY